jgi:psiF repeat
MSKNPNSLVLRAVALAVLAIASNSVARVALADDPPPAENPQPHGDRRHDPAWAACKKQADDQKLQPGDARRDFMKTCMKSAKTSAPPPAT